MYRELPNWLSVLVREVAQHYHSHVPTYERRTGEVEAARVREWRDEEGWGVLDSEQTPGGCWAHYSAVEGTGYRGLKAGQFVQLQWESVTNQDGYTFRATRVIP